MPPSGRDDHRGHRYDSSNQGDAYSRGNAPYDSRYGGHSSTRSPSYNHQSHPSSGYHSHSSSPAPNHSHQHATHPHSQSSSHGGPPYYASQHSKQYGPSNSSSSFAPREPSNRTPQRSTPSQRGGRSHFSNLSWTPGESGRSGSTAPPPERPRDRPLAVTNSSQQLKSVVSVGDPDDDEIPFRPADGHRGEDESSRKRRKIESPPRTESHGKAKQPEAEGGHTSKISFSIKGRGPTTIPEKAPNVGRVDTSPLVPKRTPAPVSPLVQTTTTKSRNYEGNTRVEPAAKPTVPATRKEIVKKKRLKPKPQMSEEFAKSESVYFRKTGNESVVGSGTYGKVYKAIHIYTGDKVALKKIRMEGERDGFPVTAIREIKLLQSLNHPNIVPLLEVMVERNDCFMVFEYLSHDLTGLLNHPSFSLTAAHKKHLARQLFEGLEYLHRRGVLHRDIKAANILVSKTGQLKLADFGLARFYQKRQKQDYTNRVITIWYRSPELLLGETQYGPAVDIWSAACVLVEIFTRHAIFPGDGGEINQLEKIYNVLGTPSRSEWPGIVELQWYELLRPTQRVASTFTEKYKERVSPEAFDLLQAMFLYDPANRPTAADVLEHAYFTSEEPKPAQVVELADIEGDWHEFESKALRKEKERQDKEARRREREQREAEKRKAEEANDDTEAKKPRLEAPTV